MILSRTLEGPPNLSLMTLEVPKISPVYDPVGIFEDLKKTWLYNQDLQQWNNSMNQTVGTGLLCYRQDALIHLLIVSEFNSNEVKSAYERLKDTQFYDKEHKRWNSHLDLGRGVWGGSLLDTETELLDILVLSKFDRKFAKDAYYNLKDTAIYDKELNQWRMGITDRGRVQDFRLSRNQLLGILVQSEFDLNAAKKSYINLQDTILYDKERKQWNRTMMSEQIHPDSDRYASDQLLGVLVLSNFDIEEARHVYEDLKKTALYDKELKHWMRFMNEEQVSPDFYNRYCRDQILGVLVEAKLAKAFSPETLLTENLPPLPNIWRTK